MILGELSHTYTIKFHFNEILVELWGRRVWDEKIWGKKGNSRTFKQPVQKSTNLCPPQTDPRDETRRNSTMWMVCGLQFLVVFSRRRFFKWPLHTVQCDETQLISNGWWPKNYRWLIKTSFRDPTHKPTRRKTTHANSQKPSCFVASASVTRISRPWKSSDEVFSRICTNPYAALVQAPCTCGSKGCSLLMLM